MNLILSNAVELQNGVPTTTSLKIAEVFGKQHKNVLMAINRLNAPSNFIELNFRLNEYTDSIGRKLPMYNITRDGFTLLAMSFTGEKAMQFKIAYIEAFNEMEKQLAAPTTVPAPALAVLSELQTQICRLTHCVQELTEYVRRCPAPRPSEVDEYCIYRGYPEIGQKFCEWYDTHDWRTANGEPLANWRLAVQTWMERHNITAKKEPAGKPEPEKTEPEKPKLAASARKRAKYDGWNLFTMQQLRRAARILVAEARGANAPAHKFCRQALVEFLSIREVTPSKVKNALLTANR